MIAVTRSWPTFVLIWAGQFVSALGSGLTAFALDVWVFQRTGSITQFALATLFFVLPRVLIAPLAGVVVDRWNRRTVMLLSDSTAAVCTLMILLFLWIDQLAVWHVYLCNVVISISSAFQRPAWSAAIGSLIPADELSRANGLRQLSRSVVSLLAPALAGFLIGQIGLRGIAFIDLITFCVAVLTLLSVRLPTVKADHTPKPTGWTAEGLEGWRYLRQNRGWSGLMLMYCFTSFFGVTTEVLLGPYILTTASSVELGWVVSATGAGMLAGGAVLSLWRTTHRLVSRILIFELMVSIITLLVGLAVSIPTLIGLMFIYFVFIALSDGNSEIFWQRSALPQFQGRIFSMRDMIASAALPLGLLIVAPLAEFVLEPAMRGQGVWVDVLGPIIGVGAGRGIALVFMLAGFFNMIVVSVFALRLPVKAMDTTSGLY